MGGRGNKVSFVIVDRNAIYDNDRDGGDRPVIALYHCGCMPPEVAHELEVRIDGQLVGRFKSQSAKRPCDPKRPHVWFELEPGAQAASVTVQKVGP